MEQNKLNTTFEQHIHIPKDILNQTMQNAPTNKQNLSFSNETTSTTTSTFDSYTTRNVPPSNMIYRKNYIKPKIPMNPSRNNFLNKGINMNNTSNNRASSLGHSSSMGNVFNQGNCINNSFYDSKTTHFNAFINIEDLLLLEEQFTQVLISLNTKSPNLYNECFELLNFYNNSSLYNKFEIYFKDENSKITVHVYITMMIYSIILLYDISFDKNYLSSLSEHILSTITLNHKSYLLLCEYILSKISSSERGNMWVKKLRDMLAVKLTHVDFYNKEFLQYSVSSPNTNKSILEIKFYSNQIAKYIRIILKNYSDSKLIEDFVKYFKSINSINSDEINNFFRKKVVRVLNKNASVLGSDISPNEARNQNFIKVPYLNKECMKKFTLVLDLDETLICYKINPLDDRQGILRFRPYLDEFLDVVSKYYELVIFTSATTEYADPIIDAIEQNNLYFDYRLYRQHAIVYNNDFVKDLSRLGRDLSKVIIVDNMPQNFRLQKENGIFIKAFWGEDVDDTALYDLGLILEQIALKFTDLRKGIAFYKDDILNKITSNFLRNSMK